MKLREALRTGRETVILALLITLFHILTAKGYGIFRDELYYLACSKHLAFGYVDQPPLVALGAWFLRHTLGTSLYALRLLPAIAAGITVFLSGTIARHLGGSRFAQFLAALSVALAPEFLGVVSIYSMNAFDLVVWTALCLIVVLILENGDPRLWLVFGLVAGIGLENKLSVLFLGFGIAVGLVAAREWRQIRDRHLWWGLAIASLLFLPHILWQVAHGWPTLEFIKSATETKNVALSPIEFFVRQAMIMNPIALPLWFGGLLYLLFAKSAKSFRTLGFAYLAIFVVMVLRHAKPYYLTPIYPVLLATGAVMLERAAKGRHFAWLRPVSLVLIALSGMALAPLAKPLLQEDTYVRYAAALGVAPGSDEKHELGRLPQFFADMHGWRELAASVSRVYEALPENDKQRAYVYASNYGEAGAIDFFRSEFALPPVICDHNNYWLWGPGNWDGQVLIVLGEERSGLESLFATVEEAGHFHCQDCQPSENDQALWVVRDMKISPAGLWSRLKHYD